MNIVPDLLRQGDGQNNDPRFSRACSATTCLETFRNASTLTDTREKPKTVTEIVHDSRERAEPTSQEEIKKQTFAKQL